VTGGLRHLSTVITKCILVGYLLMCTWCLAWTWLHDSRHAWLPLAITGDRTQPPHSSRLTTIPIHSRDQRKPPFCYTISMFRWPIDRSFVFLSVGRFVTLRDGEVARVNDRYLPIKPQVSQAARKPMSWRLKTTDMHYYAPKRLANNSLQHITIYAHSWPKSRSNINNT